MEGDLGEILKTIASAGVLPMVLAKLLWDERRAHEVTRSKYEACQNTRIHEAEERAIDLMHPESPTKRRRKDIMPP